MPDPVVTKSEKKPLQFKRYSLSPDTPTTFNATLSAPKNGGASNDGALKGVYQLDEGKALIKSDIPAMVVAEFVGGMLYQELIPGQSAVTDLVLCDNDPRKLYIISYFNPDSIANAHEAAGFSERPKLAFLRDPSLHLIEYILLANQNLTNHSLESILAAGLRLRDLDVHSGNLMLKRKGQGFDWEKIDHAFAGYQLGNKPLSYRGPQGYFAVPLVTFQGKGGRPSTQPSSHFADWNKYGFYDSPYWGKALCDQVDIPIDTITSTLEKALNKAQDAYEELGKTSFLHKHINNYFDPKFSPLYKRDKNLEAFILDMIKDKLDENSFPKIKDLLELYREASYALKKEHDKVEAAIEKHKKYIQELENKIPEEILRQKLTNSFDAEKITEVKKRVERRILAVKYKINELKIEKELLHQEHAVHLEFLHACKAIRQDTPKEELQSILDKHSQDKQHVKESWFKTNEEKADSLRSVRYAKKKAAFLALRAYGKQMGHSLSDLKPAANDTLYDLDKKIRTLKKRIIKEVATNQQEKIDRFKIDAMEIAKKQFKQEITKLFEAVDKIAE
jgi:hypothetical protein